jgi:DNA-binding transcriptional LysR family regulator
MPTELVAADVAAGRLVTVLADWQMLSLPIYLIHPSRRVPRRLTALMDLLADELRQLHPD